MSQTGALIAIEGVKGPDGSAAAAQIHKLADRLKNDGYEVAVFNFPRLDQPSTHFVKEYQGGKFGDNVAPYTAALFYALDRYQSARDIRQAVKAGKIVITTGYTGSTMAQLGLKFANAEERRGFFVWLENWELQMLSIPRPRASIILMKPGDTAPVYAEIGQLLPQDFKLLDCAPGGQLLDNNAIHDQLWSAVRTVLPSRAASTSQYLIPDQLDGDLRQSYIKTVDGFIKSYSDMLPKLSAHLRSVQKLSAADAHKAAAELLAAVLPVAVRPPAQLATGDPALAGLAQKYLPDNHAYQSEPLRLTSFEPRNELSIVPDLLYQNTSLPRADIEKEVDKWPVDRRYQALTAYLAQSAGQVLDKIRYSLDIMSDYGTYYDICDQLKPEALSRQLLTPRYGYDVPEQIELAGLSDEYENSFDQSLKIHSQLQAAGHAQEAQLVTLQGHRLRWLATYTASQLAELSQLSLPAGSRQLLSQIHEKVSEVHPTIAGIFRKAN